MFSSIIQEMPFEETLAVRVTRRHRDGVTVQVRLGPDLMNCNGVLHGGVAAAIADEAAWHAMHNHFGGDRRSTTTELKVNYLRPISGDKVIARAYLIRAGKTLCVSRVDLFDSSRRLGALAVVTYMLLE